MRKTIAILFGGCSSEYEVSLQSAAAVLDTVPGWNTKAGRMKSGMMAGRPIHPALRR